MSNSKILSILGLCKKSGDLALGFDACIESAMLKKSYLILITRDLSENTKQKLYNRVAMNLIFLSDLSMCEVREWLGKSCGIISVNNKGFAQKIRSLLNIDDNEVREDTI